jgi:cyanate permease
MQPGKASLLRMQSMANGVEAVDAVVVDTARPVTTQRRRNSESISFRDADLAEEMAVKAILRTRAQWLLYVVLGLDAAAASLGLSVLPYYIEELGGAAPELGAVIATYGIANMIASFWAGAASDYFGRKPIILLSVVGICLGFVGSALASSLVQLFVARGWLGFWSGVGATVRSCTGRPRCASLPPPPTAQL